MGAAKERGRAPKDFRGLAGYASFGGRAALRCAPPLRGASRKGRHRSLFRRHWASWGRMEWQRPPGRQTAPKKSAALFERPRADARAPPALPRARCAGYPAAGWSSSDRDSRGSGGSGRVATKRAAGRGRRTAVQSAAGGTPPLVGRVSGEPWMAIERRLCDSDRAHWVRRRCGWDGGGGDPSAVGRLQDDRAG